MTEYTQYYLAYLDLLGFKEIVKNRTCSEIVDIFEEINTQYVIGKSDLDNGISIPVIPSEHIMYYIMSDSICIYIRDDIEFALPVLLGLCLGFQLRMLSFSTPVLVRGSIAHGGLYSDRRVLFGPALVEAYQREDKLARYPRIIIPKHLIDDHEEKIIHTFAASGFLYMEQDGFYVINYLAFLCGQKFREHDRDNLMQYVKDTLKRVIDPSIREKYLYLEGNLNYHMNYQEGRNT